MDIEGMIKALQYLQVFIFALYVSLCPLRKPQSLVQKGQTSIPCL